MASSSSNATDERRSALVQENLRLVALIGRQFANRGVETIDLLQEGSIGLIKASRRFDESRGRSIHDLCRVVDSPGDGARDRRAGPHDPAAQPRARRAARGRADHARSGAAAGAGARARRDRGAPLVDAGAHRTTARPARPAGIAGLAAARAPATSFRWSIAWRPRRPGGRPGPARRALADRSHPRQRSPSCERASARCCRCDLESTAIPATCKKLRHAWSCTFIAYVRSSNAR